MTGNATEWNPCSRALASAFVTESRMDCSDARHSRLMPATWMMPWYGSRPAEVTTAVPNGMDPTRAQLAERLVARAALDGA